ncbi:MAG: hypothetical protein ACYSUQ_04890 [Planctomycetota bacterium]|jgi:hypothetical protein
MNDRTGRDKQIHENLQAAREHLEFPNRPTEEQRVQWQAILCRPQPGRAALIRGANLMREHRIVSLLGAGAVAAVIVLGFVFFFNRAPTVSAATILRDLPAALSKSILITISDVEIDYEDLAQHLPGLSVQQGRIILGGTVFVPGGISDRAYWTIEDARATDIAAAPSTGPALNWSFRLTAFMQQGFSWIYAQVLQDSVGSGPETDRHPAAPLLNMLRQGVYITVPASDSETGDGASHSPVRIIDPGFARLRDLQYVLTRIEELAGAISVEEAEPGLFVLTATDFQGVVGLPAGDEGRLPRQLREGLRKWLLGMMTEMTVQIGYRQDAGVQWVDVRYFGPADGTIYIELGDVEFDERLLDLQYQRQLNPAPVIDIAALLELTRTPSSALSE